MSKKFAKALLLKYCSSIITIVKNLRGSLALMLLTLSVISCNAQTQITNEILEGKWYLKLKHNDIGLVRTIMNFETDDNTFEAFTRQKADKDILGSWTSLIGRTVTKNFKNGSLLRIEKGIFTNEKDTLKLAGILTSALGSYNIEGYVIQNELFATINNHQGNKGTLTGSREQIAIPMEEYAELFEKSIILTKSKIYNRELMQSKEWHKFVKNMRHVSAKVQDDLEMVFAFFYYAGKLPISHYALMKIPPKTNTIPQTYKQRVFLEEKTPLTAYLKIVSFDGSAAEMDSIFSIVKQKNYKNLIVDLRNNPGGSVEAGMTFATNLVDTTLYGGVFLTQKYFNQNKTLPTIAEYHKFPHFSKANVDLIVEGIHNTNGICLKIIPKDSIYKGNVFILTNGKTASTCEPIVYGLKQQNRATIVGEKTAGAMLNGEIFNLDKDFQMIIPTADYYTSDGYRIDQNGVNPHIEVKQENALEYVMNHLNK